MERGLLVEGSVDDVAGKAKGDGGVDVAVHLVALETELVQLGSEEVEIGIIGGHLEGGADVGLGVVEVLHGEVTVGTVGQELNAGLNLDDLGEKLGSAGVVADLFVQQPHALVIEA